MKNTLSHLILSILIIALTIVGYKAYSSAVDFEQKTQSIADLQNVSDLTKSNLSNIKDITFSWFKKKKEDSPVITINNKQEFKFIIFLSLIVIIILLSYFVVSLKIFNIYGSLMTIVILIYGLITPLMMITIHKEVKYIGDIILSFESKSMISSIQKLFETNDYVIGAVILLFSVIIPLLKTFSLLLIAIFEDTLFTHKLIGFFKMIGKWSMVDVFVVAILLVFLSANKGDISKAEVEVGIYIFLMYVIASMFISLSADKMIQNIKK